MNSEFDASHAKQGPCRLPAFRRGQAWGWAGSVVLCEVILWAH